MKTKIYDKELYKSEQTFNDVVALLIAFFLGIAIGIHSMREEFKHNEEYRNRLEQEYTNSNIVVEE